MSPILLAILIAAGMAVLQDLTGYARAKQNHRSNPIEFPNPAFDWALLAVRLAIGAITGLLTALGVNQIQGLNP
jgi:hypothetical protein